jgi:uncharacterized protein YjbI with pentapeptide repeats
MANPEHLAKLQQGVAAWNAWREQNPDIKPDLQKANLYAYPLGKVNLSNAILSRANLGAANLNRAIVTGANLNEATLTGAALYFADLSEATLSRALLSGALMGQATLTKSDLSGADLRNADLSAADLNGANFESADLTGAKLRGANLANANLTGTALQHALLHDANLKGATLARANLSGANLSWANLVTADLTAADLTRAILRNASFSRANLRKAECAGGDLNNANLSEANLSNVDLRSANLQGAILDGATAAEAKLWETQRAGWSIKGIICESAFWDKDAQEPTAYAPGEFEKLYSEQTCIELFYEGGVSTFELNTLPALLHHLASLHPDSNIRLKSIEEAGGGAKISISVGDASAESTEKIKSDAMQVYQAQLALRDKETERLQIERDYVERLLLGKLIPAMLTAGAPHNVFNAPVTGVVISSGESKVDFHQTVNDNSALLALLETMMDRRADLNLPASDASKFETELQSTTAELQKPSPDKSIVSRGVQLIRTFAEEAFKSAAGKLGEQAVSADWQSWLHQLGHLISHLS